MNAWVNCVYVGDSLMSLKVIDTFLLLYCWEHIMAGCTACNVGMKILR